MPALNFYKKNWKRSKNKKLFYFKTIVRRIASNRKELCKHKGEKSGNFHFNVIDVN